jgi:hypothetical protein
MAPTAVVAADDTTPPTGWMEYYDVEDQVAELRFHYQDPESGVVEITLRCDGGPEASYPYTTKIFLPLHDPAAGGCETYGFHTIYASVRNGAGLTKCCEYEDTALVSVAPNVEFVFPLPAVTGQPFTVSLVYPDDWTLPSDAVCAWEVRWGSTDALRKNDFDWTFGGLLFEGPATKGFCGDWTFTLPWVPVRQWQIDFEARSADGEDTFVAENKGFDDAFLTATVGTTYRRIRESNLAIVQVLPDDYILVVGEPTTYRAYPLGGASITSKGQWNANALRSESQANHFWKFGGTSFTFTPNMTGPWFVAWSAPVGATYLRSGYYDPPARRPDSSRPNTTAPVATIRRSSIGTTIPARLNWKGSDVGWGIASYKVQRSVDGGAWKTVSPSGLKASELAISLTAGHRYRFRVRATDKAGNVGAWDEGPTFKAKTWSEGSGAVDYHGSWTPAAESTALGGALTASEIAGSTAILTFKGRDIGWIAPMGPAMGLAKVYVDGSYVSTIDLYAASPTGARIVYRRHWGSVGTHKLKVLVVGTAGHPAVAIDAFAIFR